MRERERERERRARDGGLRAKVRRVQKGWGEKLRRGGLEEGKEIKKGLTRVTRRGAASNCRLSRIA